VASAVRYLGVRNWQLFQDALRAYDEAIAADPANLEPRVLVGELFLEKYEGGQAVESFDDVLQVNSSHPRALLGLARTKRFNGEPDALESARRSLEVNPNLVPARVFLASLYLELESYERAAEEIEAALEVNPVSLEALTALAATRFLEGKTGEFTQLERRVLALNPRHGELYTTLAEVAARNRLYHRAAAFAQRATEVDSTSWRGYQALGINQLRLGRMTEGKANLETAFGGDPYDVWTKNTLDLLDTLDQYSETDAGRFRFVIDGKESALLALYLEEVAAEAFDRLAERYGFMPPTPIRVEVFPNHADFSVRTVGLVGLGALGVSFGPVIVMDSPSARGRGDFNWGSTFWHELAHTFHLALSNSRVPRWFTEGLAVYEERLAKRGWGGDVNPGFLMAYQQDKLLPVSELNNGFARPAYPEQLIYSYYQASLVCELIARDHGEDALVRMLRAFGDGQSAAAVLQGALGVSQRQFDRQFDAFMRDRFAGPLAALDGSEASAPHGARSEIAQRAARRPGDFMAQFAMGRVLVDEGELDEAITYLDRAKALFPEYTGADSPYRLLARIYQDRGELERAAAELDALTAINERDLDARLELASLKRALNDTEGAAAALESALYIDPLDVDLHLRLADLYVALEQWTGAIRERRAVVALDPVDRAEALYRLAEAYYGAGDLTQARRTVLRALENAPNFREAQELLLRIHAKGTDTRGSGS
jgi:tetratricopeptide (TPR) repeat protein